MRSPSANDFFIELPSVGTFRFGRRVYADKARIRIEYMRIMRSLSELDDADLDADLVAQVAIMAAYKVLCVEAPEGWESLENLDVVADPTIDEKIDQLFLLLNEKEDSFRRPAEPAGQGQGS